jgi:CubicO group peptidase (beta-lactamase class C family)
MQEDLSSKVRRHTLDAQVNHRLPSLSVAVAQAGKPLFVEAFGAADVASGRGVDPETQYRIGSVTKTFTAALVLLLAERDLVDIDEPVETYLPGTNVGRPRLRQLLAHCGGVQREAPLPMWTTMLGPEADELLAALTHAELIDRPGARWHYSNLGYAILGQVVEHVTGTPCEEMIDRELITPLGLTSTTWQPTQNAAVGYRLDPYQDTVHAEPVMQQGAIGVGGQLWSTTNDLLTWGHALIGGSPDVLPLVVTDTMHTPHVMVDRRQWAQGWGLGLILDRRSERVLSGHTGAMPGFLAALSLDQDSQTVVAVLTNVTRGVRLGALAGDVMDLAVQHRQTPLPASAQPTSPCPDHLLAVLGRWWCESEETIFTWHNDGLRAHLGDSPVSTLTTFVEEAPDLYRADSGRLHGELLHIIRDDTAVIRLEWATYPYSRNPN